jgi:hypothetical protein
MNPDTQGTTRLCLRELRFLRNFCENFENIALQAKHYSSLAIVLQNWKLDRLFVIGS